MTESNKSRSRLLSARREQWALDNPRKAMTKRPSKRWRQVLKAHDPYRDWDNDPDFRRGLAEKLMDLADAGVTERQELRSRVLASCDLKLAH